MPVELSQSDILILVRALDAYRSDREEPDEEEYWEIVEGLKERLKAVG